MTRPIEREGTRIIVLDDDLRVLLLCYVDEKTGEPHWVPPGGGLEENETHEDAARRELAEEVGVADVTLQPCNWTRNFLWVTKRGSVYRCHELFFLARVKRGFIASSADLEDGEPIHDTRWWTLAALREARRRGVDIQPRRLPELITSMLRNGPPAAPIDVGADNVDRRGDAPH